MLEITAHEWVERCVATLVYYHQDGGSSAGKQILENEADSLMAWAAPTGCEHKLMDTVLVAVEQELVERFGMETGWRLCKELARAMTRQTA